MLKINQLCERIKTKKAVIFDMDGVLFDTTKGHEQSFIDTLAKIPQKFDYTRYLGMSTSDTLTSFLSDPDLLGFLKKEKQAATLNNLHLAVSYPYVEKLLKLLKYNGIKLALATSGSKERTLLLLKKNGLDEYFQTIHTSEDVSQAKPHPAIYEKSLKSLGVDPIEAIIIEDAPNGVLSGKSAGIEVIALTHNHPKEELQKADFIVKDMYSLYSIFGYNYSDIRNNLSSNFDAKKIITIIPAAGTAKRLQLDKPKALFPIGGKEMLLHIYESVESFSEKIILVTRPEFQKEFQTFIESKKLNIDLATVQESRGNADTILAAEGKVLENKDLLIIWSDQIGVKKRSIQNTIFNYCQSSADMLVPTILKENPYIHFERNENGNIHEVKMARRKDILPQFGENDSGIFLIKSNILFPFLKKMKEDYEREKKEDTPHTEFDFVSLIPLFAHRGHKVVSSSCISEEETMGVNTLEEVKFHEQRLDKLASLIL